MSIRIRFQTGATYPRYYGDQVSDPTGTIVDLSAYANTATMKLVQFYSSLWNDIYNITNLAPSPMIGGAPYGLLLTLTIPEDGGG